jgi:hypothetical protein
MGSTALDLQLLRSPSVLIGDVVRLFGAHAPLFFSVTFLVAAPVTLLVDGVWGGSFSDGAGADSPFAADVAAEVLRTVVVPSLITALHVRIVLRLAAGEDPSIAEALRSCVSRFPAVLGAVVLYSIFVAAGLVALIVPGIWLSVLLYFGAQAVIVDDLGPVDALKRSADLVRGKWWATCGRLLLAGILFGVVAALVEVAMASVVDGVVWTLLAAVIDTVYLSLTALFGTLLFFELRAAESLGSALGPRWLAPRPEEA